MLLDQQSSLVDGHYKSLNLLRESHVNLPKGSWAWNEAFEENTFEEWNLLLWI